MFQFNLPNISFYMFRSAFPFKLVTIWWLYWIFYIWCKMMYLNNEVGYFPIIYKLNGDGLLSCFVTGNWLIIQEISRNCLYSVWHVCLKPEVIKHLPLVSTECIMFCCSSKSSRRIIFSIKCIFLFVHSFFGSRIWNPGFPETTKVHVRSIVTFPKISSGTDT